ncbi:MAG TPA: elongation factor P [Chlamydiales bacterium]|nr:elongation factor P [Chlamydiales bacterium]
MSKNNQIIPGMTIVLNNKVYRVETATKVKVPKGTPFIKTKLRDLVTDKVIEKNFTPNQEIEEVSLKEHILEYLYPEGKQYLFLDINNLEQVMVAPKILSEKIDFLKEGTQVKAMFYGDSIFAVELPQFLELMVIKTGSTIDSPVGGTSKKAILETGAEIEVPLFIEVGDILKIDTNSHEFIQRV